jgi:hypothetical protein
MINSRLPDASRPQGQPSIASRPPFSGVITVLTDVTYRLVDVVGAHRVEPAAPNRQYRAKVGKLVIENGLITQVEVDPTIVWLG